MAGHAPTMSRQTSTFFLGTILGSINSDKNLPTRSRFQPAPPATGHNEATYPPALSHAVLQASVKGLQSVDPKPEDAPPPPPPSSYLS